MVLPVTLFQTHTILIRSSRLDDPQSYEAALTDMLEDNRACRHSFASQWLILIYRTGHLYSETATVEAWQQGISVSEPGEQAG